MRARQPLSRSRPVHFPPSQWRVLPTYGGYAVLASTAAEPSPAATEGIVECAVFGHHLLQSTTRVSFSGGCCAPLTSWFGSRLCPGDPLAGLPQDGQTQMVRSDTAMKAPGLHVSVDCALHRIAHLGTQVRGENTKALGRAAALSVLSKMFPRIVTSSTPR